MTAFDQAKRKSLQKNGETMPGGRYPIRNGKDLQNAYEDWVRTGKPADVADWIGLRAKQLGLPNPIRKGETYSDVIDRHTARLN